MPPTKLLPITGRRHGHNHQVVGHTTVLDDDFTRDVLAKLSLNLSAGHVTTTVKLPNGRWTSRPLARVIYEHYRGPIAPGHEIDHKDLDPTNNLPDNLRPATRAQNKANSRPHRDSRSGYKGVSPVGPNHQFQGYVCHHQKQIWLGHYPSKHEAAWAANLGTAILHGDFARPNVIPGDHVPSPERQHQITNSVRQRIARTLPERAN